MHEHPRETLHIVEGKAQLSYDIFCSQCEVCIRYRPGDTVMDDTAIPSGEAMIQEHLEHLRNSSAQRELQRALELLESRNIPIPQGFRSPEKDIPETTVIEPLIPGNDYETVCPKAPSGEPPEEDMPEKHKPSGLNQWPIKLDFQYPHDSMFRNSRLFFAADCTAFAALDFHEKWKSGEVLSAHCPKLQGNIEESIDKLASIIAEGNIQGIRILRMHIPCCAAMENIAVEALKKAGVSIPARSIMIDPKGLVLGEIDL